MSFSNSLSINKAYVIWSDTTKKPFISPERNGFIFLSKTQALDFANKTPGSVVDDGDFYDPDTLFSQMYASGITQVNIYNGLKEENVLLGPKRVNKGFYNSDLNATISLFKCTKDSIYLEIMASLFFIVPIRIKTIPKKEIVYATIHIGEGDEEYKYLAFSDMEEYHKWSEKVAGWDPLLINFDVMEQISKDKGYIINPMGNSIVLPSAMIKKYKSFCTGKDYAG